MKIGILTFHSQLNYGGVLQCWALQTALEKLGHEVVVIDRWHDKDNSLLERGYNVWTWRQWAKFWRRSLLGLGDWNYWTRVRRTKRFLRERLHRTPYHFVDWKNAPEELGIDMLVVGSDQVWHCGDWGDPRVYLLEGAPQIPAIAYAASFGMVELPQFLNCDGASDDIEAVPTYRQGLGKFKAISCREAEGVDLCRRLGFSAAHVVDPTLLAVLPRGKDCGKQRDLVCYFLSENFEEHFDALETFAKCNHCRVKVFVDRHWIFRMPTSAAKMKAWLRGMRRRVFSRVCIEDGAGPEEFFHAFQKAKWVVSDSFHALMFSIGNGCNVRMIRPTSDMRRRIFSRIEEFAIHARGPLVADSVAEALHSLSSGDSVEFDREWLEQRRHESLEWLKTNLRSRPKQGGTMQLDAFCAPNRRREDAESPVPNGDNAILRHSEKAIGPDFQGKAQA